MDVPRITYVRHAMAVPEEGVHPSTWHLDDGGKAAALAWADRLEVGTGIGRAGDQHGAQGHRNGPGHRRALVHRGAEDPRLREAARPWIGPGYRAVAHRYLRGEQPDGWEPHAAVADRMNAAVGDALDRAGDGPAVVVSHGLALTVHLGDRLGEAFDRESFWSGLTFPDAWALGPDDVLHRSLPRSPIS